MMTPKEILLEKANAIGYDVAQNAEAPDHYRLTFRVKVQEKDVDGRDTGYYVEAHIVGYFSFPASVSEEDREYLIRVNGGTILYGILRGHIASLHHVKTVSREEGTEKRRCDRYVTLVTGKGAFHTCYKTQCEQGRRTWSCNFRKLLALGRLLGYSRRHRTAPGAGAGACRPRDKPWLN